MDERYDWIEQKLGFKPSGDVEAMRIEAAWKAGRESMRDEAVNEIAKLDPDQAYATFNLVNSIEP